MNVLEYRRVCPDLGGLGRREARWDRTGSRRWLSRRWLRRGYANEGEPGWDGSANGNGDGNGDGMGSEVGQISAKWDGN